ncbi:unnamed protein product [Citrullus colocynthis]|uniref:Uncharacterized protein n=1 Tax=Citrullus colocynthis TaxID=252529 RepID=A0ABP0ZBQ2_9ROSI
MVHNLAKYYRDVIFMFICLSILNCYFLSDSQLRYFNAGRQADTNWVSISNFFNVDAMALTTAVTTKGGCNSNYDYNARHHSGQPNESEKSH